MSTREEAIVHWMLANGEVSVRLYDDLTTADALGVLKAQGIDLAESGIISFTEVTIEVGGYGFAEKKAKAVTLRVVPKGARLYEGDFEFFVLRDEFDLMLLGMLAGVPIETDNETRWRNRA